MILSVLLLIFLDPRVKPGEDTEEEIGEDTEEEVEEGTEEEIGQDTEEEIGQGTEEEIGEDAEEEIGGDKVEGADDGGEDNAAESKSSKSMWRGTFAAGRFTCIGERTAGQPLIT